MKKKKKVIAEPIKSDYPKEKIFEFPVFNYSITVIVTFSIKDSYQKYFKKYGYTHKVEPAGLYSAYGDGKRWGGVIFIKPSSKISTVAHEVSHAIWQMANDISATKEDELIAYHIGYLTEQAYQLSKSK